jgi:hypothetical protein
VTRHGRPATDEEIRNLFIFPLASGAIAIDYREPGMPTIDGHTAGFKFHTELEIQLNKGKVT